MNPAAHPPRRRLTALLKVALFLIVLELGGTLLWALMPESGTKRNVRALIGVGRFEVQYRPNAFWHHELNPDHPDYAGQVNRSGTKGPDFEVPRPEGEFRVLCVGDSTVEGVGLPPEETFPGILEERLRARLADLPGRTSVRVVNAGVGSHNSAFNLSYLALRLIHFQPDVVVVKSAYNDYLPYCVPGMGIDYTHAFPEPYALESKPSFFWGCARWSRFLRVLGMALFRREVRVPFQGFSGVLSPEEFQSMDFSDNEDRFFLYAENLRSMVLLLRGRGVGVVFLDLPTSPDPAHFGGDHQFDERFRKLIGRLEQEIGRVAAEESVDYVRTGPFAASDFTDHCHNTAAGHARIADALVPVVVRLAAASGD